MKKTFLSLMILVLSSSVFAASHNYDCISETLEAYNSDYYYDLTPAEIDAFLVNDNDIRSAKVREVAKECDAKKTAYFAEYYDDKAPDCTPESGDFCDPHELIGATKTRMITRMELDSVAGGKYVLKTTKITRWTQNSQFIDVRAIRLDLGSNGGRDAIVNVIELASTGMGVKTTNLIMNCKKSGDSVRCSQEGKDSTLVLSIGE